ncbi:MAG: SDR family NAD(P)-dependent oxidoreductase [Spirochaetes bacterium]|nr:SDR family NAD(P)-dependent oxidoreductase [Spirochaetota bacterium]
MRDMEQEKSIFITGSSTGIGKACALHFDRLGYRVFAGVRKKADADSLRQEASDRLVPVTIDVTDPALIMKAAGNVAKRSGEGLYGLLNNAGIGAGGPVEFLDMEKVESVIRVNLLGMIAVTSAFLPMIRKSRGRIVNIGSISGMLALPGASPYAASKFAVEAFTDSLRLEMRPHGVRVSLVQPGDTESSIWSKVQKNFSPVYRTDQVRSLYGFVIDPIRQALEHPRLQPVEKVVNAVEHAFLSAKPRSRYRVGRDARIFAMVRHLPDSVRDRLVMRGLERQ